MERSQLPEMQVKFFRNVMRVGGSEPKKILTEKALAGAHRTYGATLYCEEDQIRILGQATKELIKELLSSVS